MAVSELGQPPLYLVFRVTETNARTLARNTGPTVDQVRNSDRFKALDRYTALLFGPASARPAFISLSALPAKPQDVEAVRAGQSWSTINSLLPIINADEVGSDYNDAKLLSAFAASERLADCSLVLSFWA